MKNNAVPISSNRVTAREGSLREAVFDHSLGENNRINALARALPAEVDSGWKKGGASLISLDNASLTENSFGEATARAAQREISAFLNQDPIAVNFGTQREGIARTAAEELLLEFESRRARAGHQANPEIRPFEYRLLLSDLFDTAQWLKLEPKEAIQPALYSSWIAGLIVLDMPGEKSRRVVSLHRFLEGDGPAPGSGTVVLAGAKVIETRTFGFTDLEQKTPVDPHTTLFDLASMSKVFTGIALLKLVDRGKVNLHDSICSYLPEAPTELSGITVVDLLRHRSGLVDYFDILNHLQRDSVGLGNQQVLDACGSYWRQNSALTFSPGSRYDYANLNYVLLAEIVARTAGREFRDFLRDEVFQPAGMQSTILADFNTIPINGKGYTWKDDRYIPAANSTVTAGDGRVFTTLEDMTRWHAQVSKGILQRLLSPGGVEMLTATVEPDGRYGAGLRVDRKTNLFGHAGWDCHGVGINFIMPGDAPFSAIFLSKANSRKDPDQGLISDETRTIGRALVTGWRPAIDIGSAIVDF